MKKSILILVFGMVLFVCCRKTTKELPILKADKLEIQYVLNDTIINDWYISPELNPDILEINYSPKPTKVKFRTEIDSIEFNINPGDTISFAISMAYGDTAITQLIGKLKNVNFSDEYVKKYQGIVSVEIPKVHELANIMIALTIAGNKDSKMINKETEYYKTVLRQFSEFKNYPTIDTLNQYITSSEDEQSIWYNYALRMNSTGYLLNDSYQIYDDNIIHKIGFPYPEDPFIKFASLFEDFAKSIDFNEFYNQNNEYYNSLILEYYRTTQIEQMQNWLEKLFGFSYGSYRIIISPLVGTLHSTRNFEDNGFKQTFMFVNIPSTNKNFNDTVNALLSAKSIFTEIDHNFVNPTTDKYQREIGAFLQNAEKWLDINNKYAFPYKNNQDAIFNEYMTWALFSLYCMDNFNNDDSKKVIQEIEKQMIDKRGFLHFKQFNEKLIEIYFQKNEQSIDQLYNKIIEWCRNQQ